MQKCETCEYEKVCEIQDFVRNDLKSCKTYKEKKVKTNSDKIRLMSDEELAEFFARKSPCDYYCNYSKRVCNGVSCKQGILEWLKSPTND